MSFPRFQQIKLLGFGGALWGTNIYKDSDMICYDPYFHSTISCATVDETNVFIDFTKGDQPSENIVAGRHVLRLQIDTLV